MNRGAPVDLLPPLDRASSLPIWFQIMRALEARIIDQTWLPGDRLPSENQLREYFGVSRTSVRDALERLEDVGMISRQQGRGAFVEAPRGPSAWKLPTAPSLLGELGRAGQSPLTSQVLRAGVEQLAPGVAAVIARGTLGEFESSGFVIERVRAVGGRTAVHVANHLPLRFQGVLPELRDPRASLYASIAKVTGVHIARMHRTIEATVADRTLAALLEVEPGHPIVVVEAVAYDQSGTPIDFSRASVRTDRLRVSVDTGFDANGISSASASGTYPSGGASHASTSINPKKLETLHHE